MSRRPSRCLRNLFCMEENVDTKLFDLYKPESHECFSRMKVWYDYLLYSSMPSGFAAKIPFFYILY